MLLNNKKSNGLQQGFLFQTAIYSPTDTHKNVLLMREYAGLKKGGFYLFLRFVC